MRIYETVKSLMEEMESMSDYRLKDVATIRTNFEDADFWIRRKGSKTAVGKPTKEFDEEFIGIRVDRTDIVLPEFLYYVFEYLHMRGDFERIAKGTLRLVHIKTEDVENIKLVDQ